MRALTGPLLLDILDGTQLRSLVKEAVAHESDLTDRADSTLDGFVDDEAGVLFLAESRYDWGAVIERLNQGTHEEIRAKLGTPNSAQVTRSRLLRGWNGIDATCEGRTLVIRLKG